MFVPSESRLVSLAQRWIFEFGGLEHKEDSSTRQASYSTYSGTQSACNSVNSPIGNQGSRTLSPAIATVTKKENQSIDPRPLKMISLSGMVAFRIDVLPIFHRVFEADQSFELNGRFVSTVNEVKSIHPWLSDEYQEDDTHIDALVDEYALTD
ncbi:hypothetical protein PRIPAC_71173 [Pristionchus pacificus]|uniref:Uncharacterized protein n=1 Tax=Pristionchus pacificus TaxID=54126 RepID=A0A2A6BGQ5_PRIPA|nr:hypothetical protein PRIPAC_71173 [Pristionchus pacificus]|eukprot:PDM65036.1 hypothetical protein PRIPAC_53292 [Pristionchus pacificus]